MLNRTALVKLPMQIDVKPLRAELAAHPELWGQRNARKGPDSPHNAMQDIWLRYRHWDELTEGRKYGEPHFATWYPEANLLPATKDIAHQLAAAMRAVYLGGVMITRIPPGGRILPHDDRGSWHAEFHNCKVYVPIRSNADCINYCDQDSAVMRPGEAWTFNNLLEHSVENNGSTDRETLIVCMRVE